MSADPTEKLLSVVLDLVAQVQQLDARSAQHITETARLHKENRREIGKIHSGITNSNATVKKIAAEQQSIKAHVRDLTADVAEMKPAVNRWRAAAAFRAAMWRCIRRSWLAISALAASIGAGVVWVGDHWPKIAAFLRSLRTLLIFVSLAVLAVLAALARVPIDWPLP